jgi:DEAD/DEAH box helicase domain-containing protein
VRSQVVGYQRTDSFTGEVIENVDLELPPSTLVTRSFWYTFEAGVVAASGVSPERLPGALHALEHAAIGLLPLFTICDRWDVGGISTVWLDDTGAPTVAIYDGYPGGAGVAELGFDAADRHLAATLAAIEACGCLAGCPSCVQSPKCGNGNEPLDKAGAVALLRASLATPRPPSSPMR